MKPFSALLGSLAHDSPIDARYRHALQNWTSFVQAWVPLATEADWSLPHLPAKELMQRIYRDVRFSKDKTRACALVCDFRASHASFVNTHFDGTSTAYKTHLGASHCAFADILSSKAESGLELNSSQLFVLDAARTGRKGPFALYYIHIGVR